MLSFKENKWLTCLGASGIAIGIAGVAPAGDILNLDFEDGLTGPFFNAGGFTSGETPRPKPEIEVLDDSLGLGTGNALFAESRGTGSEMYIPLPTEAVIGPDFGDFISVSFDFRVDTSTSSQPDNPITELRFGFFNDGDNSLGNFSDGGLIFGQDGGDFDGTTGPIAPDFSIYTRLPIGLADGGEARIRTEAVGDTGILSGSSQDGGSIVGPSATTISVDTVGNGVWPAIAVSDNYKITMTVSRELETLPFQTIPEEVVRGTIRLENTTTGDIIEMGNRDAFGTAMAASTFQYLVFEDVNDDFDYVLDNFVVSDSTASGLLGDLDTDGDLDVDDIDILGDNLGIGTTPEEGDIDNDGDVDTDDLAAWTALIGTVPGDANLDQLVDTADLAILAGSFNQAVTSYGAADFNLDDGVNTADLAILAGAFGFDGTGSATAATAAIPEPGVVALGLIASLAGFTRRTRSASNESRTV